MKINGFGGKIAAVLALSFSLADDAQASVKLNIHIDRPIIVGVSGNTLTVQDPKTKKVYVANVPPLWWPYILGDCPLAWINLSGLTNGSLGIQWTVSGVPTYACK